EGSQEIKIERNILEMSNPDAEVTINEYMVACYGTTEYSENMNGITLKCVGDTETKEIEYAYKCREAEVAGAKEVYAVIPPVDTKVSLTAEGKNYTGYVKEGYAFSPMLTLGYTTTLKNKEVFATCLKVEKAN
ncbi:MAG: hypothetical protein ACLRMH_08525, partial [Lachnospiraceae bacterium]